MRDNQTRGVALFIDHYNIHIGCNNMNIGRYNFDVLVEAANKEGQMVFGRVYLRTDRSSNDLLYEFFKRGVEPIYSPEYPKKSENDSKSLADPMMVCDIMQTLYERSFIETFVIVSGDKDFIPVIRKISEHGRQVIVIGVGDSTADSLIKECNRLHFDFLDYTDIHRDP